MLLGVTALPLVNSVHLMKPWFSQCHLSPSGPNIGMSMLGFDVGKLFLHLLFRCVSYGENGSHMFVPLDYVAFLPI